MFEEAEKFRFQELWTRDVANVFKTNLDSIQKLFKVFHHKRKYMSIESAYYLFEKVQKVEGPQANMPLKDFNYMYAMSKEVVVSESEDGLKYLRTKFLELVELIGRVAVYKFDDSDLENYPLTQKIELLLDELLPLVK